MRPLALTRSQIVLGLAALGLLALKLLGPGEIQQIPAELLLSRLGDEATRQGAAPVSLGPRRDLAGFGQATLSLPGCEGPLRVVAVTTQEDLSSALRIATPPELASPVVSVYAQGREYETESRLAMRIAAVANYLGLKFGLADIAPSGTLLAVIRAPGCTAYRSFDWPGLWSAVGRPRN